MTYVATLLYFVVKVLTLRELVKAVLRLELMLSSNGSLHVMRAIPAVRFRTMCCAAMCIRWRSGSKLKSYKSHRKSQIQSSLHHIYPLQFIPHTACNMLLQQHTHYHCATSVIQHTTATTYTLPLCNITYILSYNTPLQQHTHYHCATSHTSIIQHNTPLQQHTHYHIHPIKQHNTTTTSHHTTHHTTAINHCTALHTSLPHNATCQTSPNLLDDVL